jgi:large subunit ribosomal protein L22
MQDVVASARLHYLGTSAQKARLVVDLIRGRLVEEAGAILRHTKKAVAQDLERLLDSAIANARQKRQEIDVDRLYVRTVFVDGGPSLKRIRPAPMGRAFRVLKRTCHVSIGLGERAVPTPSVRKEPKQEKKTAAAPRAAAKGARKQPARPKVKRPAARKKKGAKSGARR